MPTVPGFPRELLAQPSAARLAHFVGKVVAHPRLKAVHHALLNAIRQPMGAPLVLVVGPTGVGKTTLRLRIEQQLMEEALPDLAQDPSRIPVVAVEAAAPESGQFNWKDYYTRALMALDEPLVAHKVDYATWGLRRDGRGRIAIKRGAATPELRLALEQCLRYRRPAAFIVDEAQHLKKMASGRRLLDQMDTLKSLAAMTGTVHVLVGTYELLGLANLSAQLSRRSIEIHFGRYQAESADDLLAFQSVVLTFQRHLPLAGEPDLIGQWQYLYEGSAGCIGVLKSWLNRALAAALDLGEPTLTRRRLERQAAPARKLISLVREIKEGEEALRDDARERDHLRTLLGLEDGPAPFGAAKANAAASMEPAARRPRRPGGRAAQRRPTRDPVGQGRPEHGPA
ncbi:MAG: ATP-binding protein [Chloroflexi bacterium]|nr:ATP-binding protein [Chloroflexota bacterium]